MYIRWAVLGCAVRPHHIFADLHTWEWGFNSHGSVDDAEDDYNLNHFKFKTIIGVTYGQAVQSSHSLSHIHMCEWVEYLWINNNNDHYHLIMFSA